VSTISDENHFAVRWPSLSPWVAEQQIKASQTASLNQVATENFPLKVAINDVWR
jgi:hypothetical protein